MKRIAFLAAACLLGAIHPEARAEIQVFESRHYRITTDADKALAMEIAAHMDAVHAEYSRRFADFRGGGTVQKYPLHVYALQEDYLKFLRGHGINGAGSGGMFFKAPTGTALATFLEKQSLPRVFHTLRHEGFHQFAFHKIGPDLPVWCNEGLAEYFGEAVMVRAGPRPDQQVLRTGQIPVTTLAQVQAAVKADRHIPFEQLITMSDEEWSNRVKRGSASLQYEQSWAIIHFLVSDPKYQRPLINYLMMVSKGTPSRDAFARSFGAANYKLFEEAWKKWIVTAEPNPEKIAAMRLMFIGQGAEWLMEQNRPVDTLETIREQLKERRFRMSFNVGFDQKLEISAQDEQTFQPPDSGNPKSPSSLEQTAGATAGSPPELAVRGLRLAVKLKWTESGGKPSPQVVYEEPPPPGRAPVKKKENGQ
jgi:hypothetical protein